MAHIHHNQLRFYSNTTATTQIYTLSLHDALPISDVGDVALSTGQAPNQKGVDGAKKDLPFCGTRAQAIERIKQMFDLRRSEEHTSELQSQSNIVCRLLLEKKKQR